MPRKRDGFVPLGDVVAGVELPAGLTRTPAAPGALHHFTTLHQVNQPARARHRRMIGRSLVELVAEECPQRQRIGDAPGDLTLRVDALEIADYEQAEIDPGRDAGPTDALGVKRRAPLFHKLVESVLVQHLIQSLVKRMSRSPQVLRRHPQLSLARARPFSQRHDSISPARLMLKGKERLLIRAARKSPTFTTGC